MKLGLCSVKNFGSYESFEMDLSDSGLTLLYGKTGSGKSTIPDMPCWILYGVTAKNGSVDDVRSWNNPDKLTEGTQQVTLGNKVIWVTRIRGRSSENDLYWKEASSDKIHRGKDITDTQKLLDKRLGASAELYFMSAYYNEFSPVGHFFTSKAKDRRQLFDMVAPLELPDTLALKCSENKKTVKADIAKLELSCSKLQGALEHVESSINRTNKYCESWEEKKKNLLQELGVKYDNFELEKKSKIEALTTKVERFESERAVVEVKLKNHINKLNGKIRAPAIFSDMLVHTEDKLLGLSKDICGECGASKENENKTKLEFKLLSIKQDRDTNNLLIRDLAVSEKYFNDNTEEINPYEAQLRDQENSKNLYGEQLEAEKSKVNPFIDQLNKFTLDKAGLQLKLQSDTMKKDELSHLYSSLNHLYDLSSDLRGNLLSTSVQDIEKATNDSLEKHFDSEIRVSFALEGSDSLEVSLYTGGHACNYKQLSKGQRRLLTLCFVTSMMSAAANKASTHFDNLWFDESLDGLDSDLKLKSFSLLESLALDHQSIFVIDHDPGLQNCFSKKYKVTMDGDTSQIELDE